MPDQQSITFAAIALATGVALVSQIGAYAISARRIGHEQGVERDRKDDAARRRLRIALSASRQAKRIASAESP
jgi:hypothetical protein